MVSILAIYFADLWVRILLKGAIFSAKKLFDKNEGKQTEAGMALPIFNKE